MRWVAVSVRRLGPLRGVGGLRPSLSEGRPGRGRGGLPPPAGGVLRVPSLEVFFPLGCIDRVCESLRQRERVIMARNGKEGSEPSASLFRDLVDARSSWSGVPG